MALLIHELALISVILTYCNLVAENKKTPIYFKIPSLSLNNKNSLQTLLDHQNPFKTFKN